MSNKLASFLASKFTSGNESKVSLSVRKINPKDANSDRYLSETVRTVNPVSAFCEAFITKALLELSPQGKKAILPSEFAKAYAKRNIINELPSTYLWASKRLESMFATDSVPTNAQLQTMLGNYNAFHASNLAQSYKAKADKLQSFVAIQSFDHFLASKAPKAKAQAAKA